MLPGGSEPPEADGAGRSRLTLVVPTRNEAGNVPRLVSEVRQSLSDIDYRLVFVDDSTDETPEIVRSLAEEDPRITLIHREGEDREGGLSTAVTTGIDTVSEASEYTCVMDADLQHPPQKVREMLGTADNEGSDVVVASRYVSGGSYEGLSGPLRRAVSTGSKYLAQIVFREARKTTDPMTGFFLVRNEAISGIQLRPTGFKILVEILVCAPDLKVVEVPFNFQARNAGVSKASLGQGAEYLSHLASLFWYVPSAGRFWKFAMVGASGVLVNMAVLILLAEYVNAHKVIAWMFAVGLSTLSNFLLNSAFTWRDIRHASRIHFLARGALAYPVAIIGIGANFAVYYPLLKYVTEAFPYYVFFNFLGILAGMMVNFTLNSRVVFRPSKPDYPDPEEGPDAVADRVRSALGADLVALVRAGDTETVGLSSGGRLTGADRSIAELALGNGQPMLVVNGPRRLPQARTNARWDNSLAVPVSLGNQVRGVFYVTRRASARFSEDDLHWLTAYVQDAGGIFDPPPEPGPQEAPAKVSGPTVRKSD
ncbi:glycosyltransferase [Rubrobacter aplysinae]|uniref:glycosyltransferase n=1 Tax=Rubrobacter aplysinae TaxID=909625 RepID=UPI00069D4A8F|nr:glycosyltransferase [Rubrobacter aplysinae]